MGGVGSVWVVWDACVWCVDTCVCGVDTCVCCGEACGWCVDTCVRCWEACGWCGECVCGVEMRVDYPGVGYCFEYDLSGVSHRHTLNTTVNQVASLTLVSGKMNVNV